MVFSRQRKNLGFLVVSLPVFLAFVSGVPLLWADGGEPFSGIIEKMEVVDPSALSRERSGIRYTHTIMLSVTDQERSPRVTNGMEIRRPRERLRRQHAQLPRLRDGGRGGGHPLRGHRAHRPEP